ncbi:MAG: glycosyltransferase [Anaerolineaceae bacterium]|nr:glycosyltransferase [Anaerolineaceae bacterium]
MENQKKNILILTADAGFGHRSAAIALKSAFEELNPDLFSISLINPLDNKKTPNFLTESQSEYDKWVRNVPELYKFGYELSDASIPVTILETILVVSLFEVFHEIIEEYNPDIVINTYPLYQAPFVAVRSLQKKNIPMVTIVTDLATVHQIWFNEKVDWLIVPTEIVRDDAIETGVDPEKISVIGIPVNPMIFLIQETKHELRKTLGWDENLTCILAVGSKRIEHFKENLTILDHSGFSFQLIIVTGKDKNLFDELNTLEWHHKVFLYEFVDKMPEFMKASDLLIAKAGGLIVTEALASGLPIILIDVIPGQETGNAQYVLDGNAGFWVKNSLEFIENFGDLMVDGNKNLIVTQDNAKKIGKPSSATQIARFVNDKLESNESSPPPKVEFIQKIENLLYENRILEKFKEN